MSLIAAQTAAAAALAVPAWLWIGFFALMALLLALDMFVFHRHSHEPSLRESAGWTVFWCCLALAFNALVWWWAGKTHALEFFMGYVVEWSLSMDNVFVFVVIFAYFGVPLKYQYRVLFWGILGAIVMRLVFILAASHILRRFEWVFYVFGAFLIYTAIKLAVSRSAESNPEQNVVLRLARRYLPVAEGFHGDHFLVRQVDASLRDADASLGETRPREGRWQATSLLLVLLVIESTDVLFAVDSVPAIFGITKEPFIVFTSNIFAIMGLRALYFLLAGVMTMFRYLNYGLAAILGFIGVKMVLMDYWHPSHELSLLVIVGLLAASMAASLVAAHRQPQPAEVRSEVRGVGEGDRESNDGRVDSGADNSRSTVER